MKKLVRIDAKNGTVVWSSDWSGKVAVTPPLSTVMGMSIFLRAMELDLNSWN